MKNSKITQSATITFTSISQEISTILAKEIYFKKIMKSETYGKACMFCTSYNDVIRRLLSQPTQSDRKQSRDILELSGHCQESDATVARLLAQMVTLPCTL